MKPIYCLIAILFLTSSAYTQTYVNVNGKNVVKHSKQEDSTYKHKKKLVISSSEGVTVEQDSTTLTGDDKEEKNDEKFHIHWWSMDLGVNSLQDKTSYNSTEAQHFLNVPSNLKTSSLFNLNQGKSINVNLYPIMTKYRLLKTNNQRIYLVSGLGLQLYNFRFDNPIDYRSPSVLANTNTSSVGLDTVSFKKNKLAFDYLMIPLELVFKTKVGNKNWFVYGFGITGGYRLSSWTKQISSERGKEKVHDKFNFNDFNSCLMGEIGLDGFFRLYATYQVTSLQENGLDQHPFSIGIRFMGI